MAGDLLKAGEFAQICGTTKETLRHYKDIGLLMPIAKAQNGYQLYSPLQISDYLLISSLQQAGCSLQEIKGYLSEPDAEALESVIETRIEAIANQRRTLLLQKHLLENTLTRTRARNDWRRDPAEFKLEVCDAEYFLDSDISDAFVLAVESDSLLPVAENSIPSTAENNAVETSNTASENDALFASEQVDEQTKRIVRHILDMWRCGQKQGDVSELQGNYRVGQKAFLAGEPWKDFHLCMRVRPHKQRCGLIEKPAGTYFKYLRTMNLVGIQDDLEPLMELFGVYEEMRRVLIREGFTPTSDVYERELSLYTGKTDELIYSELSVRVDC